MGSAAQPARDDVRSRSTPLDERGSFTHGRCADCSWVGPGRRAREAARRDLVHHRATAHPGATIEQV